MSTNERSLVVREHDQGSVPLQCPKLTETNYTSWSIFVETVLRAQGLWKTVTGEDEDEKRNYTTKAIIYSTLPENVLLQVAKHKNAQDVWNSIKIRCLGTERVQKARLQTLKGEMEKLKMKEGESINDFEGKMGSIVERFKCLGVCVDEEETVRKFLNSVTKKYLPIVSSIEQYGDIENMPLVAAVGRLKAYEDRLEGYEEKEENQGQLLLTNGENDGKHYGRGRGRGSGFGRGERGRGSGSSRFDKSKFRCYECGEFGHFANECTKWKGKEKEANLIGIDDEPALL